MLDILPAVVDAVQAVGRGLAERQRPEPVAAATVAEAMAAFAEVDRPAADRLRAALSAVRPQARWLTEEFDVRVPPRGEWWSCDAVDGAVQYLGGLPHWAVTATLIRDGEAWLAVVHSPREGLTYTAVRGGGSQANGRGIAPPHRQLAALVAATSQPPLVADDPVALRRAGASLGAVLPRVLAVRNLGPTALQVAHVGSGRLGAFWEYGADAGNLLPGALIAAEAGAVVTDARGEVWTPGADSFVAAAPGVHRELLTALAEV